MLVSNAILLTVIATDTTNNFYAFVSFSIIVCVFHVIRKQQTHAKPLWIRIPSSDDGHPTILGNFSFDENGEVFYDPIVLIVKDGELQFLG